MQLYHPATGCVYGAPLMAEIFTSEDDYGRMKISTPFNRGLSMTEKETREVWEFELNNSPAWVMVSEKKDREGAPMIVYPWNHNHNDSQYYWGWKTLDSKDTSMWTWEHGFG